MRAAPSRWSLLLAGLVLVLAGLLGVALLRPLDIRPLAGAPDGGALAGSHDPLAGGLPRPGPIASYGETLARPLFEAGRRAAVARAPEPPRASETQARPAPAIVPPPATQGLKLLGVVRTGSDPIRALIRAGDGEAGQWVGEGGQLGRWKVESIGDGRVVLEAQGLRVELAMFAEPRPLAGAGPKAPSGR